MADTTENRRAGRESELRTKLKETTARYESVFGKPLSTIFLKEYLDECMKQNRFNFLRDRMGLLSDTDVGYMSNILKEKYTGVKTEKIAEDELTNSESDADSTELDDLSDESDINFG